MIESTTDCGHLCCSERQMPFHDHFLSPAQCPTCEAYRKQLADIEAAAVDLRQKLGEEQRRNALALASSPSDRRSAVDGRGGDDGGAQGRRPLGSAGTVQAPPTSEAEATIQRLIAQADALAATATELAFQAWHGTQRCGDCYRMRTCCGRCLQVIDALTAAGFGDQMRDWAGS